jgi:uncharacterized OsmC-like protein
MTGPFAETAAKFRADPSAARSNPTVTATLTNGHARLSSGPFNWDSDLPPSIGGGNLAPSPTAYLLGALAGCGVVFLRDTLAPLFEVELDDVTATASATADTRGLLGMDGIPADLAGLALRIEVATTSPTDRVEAMLAAWRERCPIFLALRNANEIELSTAIGAVAAN